MMNLFNYGKLHKIATNKKFQSTAGSAAFVCQENNEVVRNYIKDESRSLVIG